MTDIIKFILLCQCMISGGWVKAEEPDKSLYYYDSDHDTKLNDNIHADDMNFVPVMVRRNDFFLKASKSVPRIGRRNDFFYAKTHKSVPRIGRRNDFFLKASKSIPRIGRRNDFTSQSDKEGIMDWPWFREHEYIPKVLKKDTNYEHLQEGNKEIPESRQQPLV
ncbi:uncharacterized protein LOC106661408 isoform X1 [Cimex lectularius]|uniref:Uncharacterized protein n=2 Tax=Cimex lectularius TaxID=79782 RepID=A0A8I6R738_CIMLE|nr:uncharacterized protein LOC106661408 isoform X1 [Cimex lectularius]